MFKKIAIFSFIPAVIFYFVLISGSKPTKNIVEEKTANGETQYLIQENTAVGESELPQPESSSLDEIQEKLDDIAEQIDILAQEIDKLSLLKQVAGVETELSASSTEMAKDEEKIEEISTSTEIVADILETEERQEQKVCAISQGLFAERNKVIINELAWAGSVESADGEWIELKNISGTKVNLAGWQIFSQDGKIKIIFKKEDFIMPGAFYILERTNDQTLSWLTADKIYTGALKNDGDSFYFFDENCRLQDEISAVSYWPAGNNDSKRTMERKGDFSWQTSANPGGTPKAENSGGYYENLSTGGGIAATPQKPAYLKILISEIQIAGKESGKDDFVEFYNANFQDIDLTGWYLQRKTETGDEFATYVSSKQLAQKTIKSRDYFVVANASSLILAQATTNNPLTENNTLALKNPNGDIVDKIGFGNAKDFEGVATINPEAGNSIGRRWSTSTENYIDTDNNYDDFESQISTPGLANQSKKIEDATSSEATTTEDLPLPEPEFGTVIINEIAWMGNASSSAEEWIELYNNTNQAINITNWSIYGADTGKCLNFSDADGATITTISSYGYLIYANNKETIKNYDGLSLVDIWDSTIGMNNNSPGQLILYNISNCQGKIIDAANQSIGNWFAGDNNTKQTMEKKNPAILGGDSGSWASSANPGGTPKAENSAFAL